VLLALSFSHCLQKVIAFLAKLHPPASGPVPLLPGDSSMIQQIDLAVLSRLVRSSLANGSAPGGSGWTGDLILALIEDHDCLTALGVLVKDILNGALTGRARELLVSSILFAGKKASGGSRPIAIGEAFYKLACLYALDLVHDRVRTALGPIQFAFSPGGPESALNILQSAIELHPGLLFLQTFLMLSTLAPAPIFLHLCLIPQLYLHFFALLTGRMDRIPHCF